MANEPKAERARAAAEGVLRVIEISLQKPPSGEIRALYKACQGAEPGLKRGLLLLIKQLKTVKEEQDRIAKIVGQCRDTIDRSRRREEAIKQDAEERERHETPKPSGLG